MDAKQGREKEDQRHAKAEEAPRETLEKRAKDAVDAGWREHVKLELTKCALGAVIRTQVFGMHPVVIGDAVTKIVNDILGRLE